MKVLMTLLLLALGVNAARLSDLTYTTTNGKVAITDCKETATGELVIPQTIGGKPVTSIKDYAFRNCSRLTSITIADSVASIELGAFYNCTGLTSITIPDSITIIKRQTFQRCSNLGSVTIPDSIYRIELGAFSDCTALTSITIPDSVTSIGDGAFTRCRSLTNITFLGTVAPLLGNNVFNAVNNEATYSAPTNGSRYPPFFGGVRRSYLDTDGDGVYDVDDAFPNDSTETADTDGDGVGNNADLDDDGDGINDDSDAFPNDPNETVDTDGDGVGNNADLDDDGDGVDDASDAFPNDSTETVDTDGDGVGDNSDAFPSNAIETVDSDGDGVGDNTDLFPNDATETVDLDGDGIGDNTDLDDDGDGVDDASDSFPNDANETADTDGDGIGDNGDIFPNFDDSLITYSDEGDSVTITDCETSASGSLIIPDTIRELPVTSIGFNAFFECTSLTSITIPNGVTSIGLYAFASCTSLTSITIPNSVTSIQASAFPSCIALTTINVDDGNLNYTDVNGILFNAEMTLLHTYPTGKTDSDYTIPEGVTNIEIGAFINCTNLKSVTLPQSVTNIGYYAFQECRSLKNLFMQGPPPSSVGRLAFANLAPNALVKVKPEWRDNYGAAGDTWYGLFVVEQDEEECDNEELTNTITTLVAQLAQKDAQIAEKNAQIVELEKRPSLEDIQDTRAGSVVLTSTGNGTVILKMMIEESSDLSVWENSEESIEVELPLAEGKKFLRFALK